MVTAEDCVRCAQDCVRLAELTTDPEMRSQLLRMACNWMDAAEDELSALARRT
jgi:hypothetical protein